MSRAAPLSALAKHAARLRNLARLTLRGRPTVGATPCDVVHAERSWRLLRYRAGESAAPEREAPEFVHRTPVLMVPSLINRHYVLDLRPGRSLAAYLLGRGHDVFVIDWGTPGPEDRYLGFDDYAGDFLGRALERCCAEARSERAHVLGYCLGGTLAVAHAAAFAREGRVASLALLAAPVRFDDGGLLSVWMRSPAFDPRALVEATGLVPWPMMQAAFYLLKPFQLPSKLVALYDRAWDQGYLDGYAAVETWGADNVSLAGRFFEEYVERLYRSNELIEGRFSLCGRPASLASIECPVLTVTFEHDHIVPHESASALLGAVSSAVAERLHYDGGHIGSVISAKAEKTLWPALSGFFAKGDVAAQQVRTFEREGARARESVR